MDKPNFETYVIDSKDLLNRLKDYSNNVGSEYLVIDAETDSATEKTAKLYGIGLCFNENKAFYIVWRDKAGNIIWSGQEQKDIIAWLHNTCRKHKVIGHNIIYDVLVLENNLNLDITESVYSDTILQKHSLDEEPPFALKELAVSILGEWADKAQEALKDNVIANGGSWKKEQKDMYKADTAILAEYCCFDVILTYLLFCHFEPQLEAEGLIDLFYNQEVMPLYKEVTFNMKRNGFPVDVEYFEKLKVDIQNEIDTLEKDLMNEIKQDVYKFEQRILDEHCPVSTKGTFPKVLADAIGAPLPINKDGKITLSKAGIIKQRAVTPQFEGYYKWLLGEGTIEEAIPKGITKVLYTQGYANSIRAIQEKVYFDKNPGTKSVFNLASNDHLAYLIHDVWGNPITEKTPTGKPKVNAELIEALADTTPQLAKLVDYKKLNKLLSTYVEGILDRHISGIIYTSMLQFGTTSGRYSSQNPNLQNIPRMKDDDSGLSALVLKYVNAIKKGFIAGKGYKIVNADYSSLEPVCFAHMSGDEGLRNIFRNGEDLYSRIAIDVFKLKGVSANKKDPLYLKNVQPEFRQKSKVFCLAVPYGAEEARISEEMKVSYQEAKVIIDSYLNAYPQLKRYMTMCNFEAKKYGKVKTEFGRIRHLKKAQSLYLLYGDELLDWKYAKRIGKPELRREFKNQLNNSKNFKIQGLAAHIVNRAMIALTRAFKANNIDGWVCLQVHDEITAIVREDQAELASKLMQDCMENTTKISVPLQAEPLIADSWDEAK